MDTTIIVYFLLGGLFGSVLISTIKSIISFRSNFISTYQKLDELLDIPLYKYTFISRTNHFVKIITSDYDLYLDLNEKSLSIFYGKEMIIYSNDLNKNKLNYLYDKLNEGFYNEIYVNIININNNTISNNVFNNSVSEEVRKELNIKTNDYTPTMDEVLDKISKYGLEALTQSDLDILNNRGI